MQRLLYTCLVVLLSLSNLCPTLTAANPIAAHSTELVIDAAPSVVSYQGSSQTHAHLVLAPMGRSLGYIEPSFVNRNLTHNEKLNTNYDVLDISPVYVPN